MKKRIICLFIAALMLVSVLPIQTFASSLSCSAFISNYSHQQYIDTMMEYYISNNTSLQSALNNGKSVVFMFEGGSDNYPSNAYSTSGSNQRNQAVVIVVQKKNGVNQIAFYDEYCSSVPAQPSDTDGSACDRQTIILDGIYGIETCNHQGKYGALHVKTSTGYYTPPSDPDGFTNTADGINIHTRSSYNNGSYDSAWSWGCQLIGGANDSSNTFNAFMKAVTGINYNVWLSWSNKSFNTITAYQDVGYYVVDRYLARDGLTNLYTQTAIDNITAFSSSSYAAAITNTTIPGKPSLKDFARSYASGSTTVFTWDSTENTTHYNMYVDLQQSDGLWERTYTWFYVNSGYSYAFSDGIYRVLLQSTNSNADGWPYSDGDWVTFAVGSHTHDKGSYAFYEAVHPHCDCYVCSICGETWRDTSSSNYMASCLECHRPDKPVVTGVKGSYSEQESVTINWTVGSNTTHCNYWLYQKDGSEWKTLHKIDYATGPVVEDSLSTGEYRIEIVATNSDYWEADDSTWLWNPSEYVYFTVYGKIKLSFDTNGGSFPNTVETFELSGINTPRGEHQLVVFTGDGLEVDTNSYGFEVAVNKQGKIVAQRLYGDGNHLTIPIGGFVLSGHGGESSPDAAFVAYMNVGEYVAYDKATMMAYHYTSYDEYLSAQKYVIENTGYDDLPEPKKEGYYFKGWYLSNETASAVNYLTDCTSSQLYAKWDDTPVPITTVVYNNHKYELFDYHMSWTDAKAFCEARGGHLVTITNATEQAEVLALAKTGSFCTYYIGCSDAETEGTWKWVTGELFDYQNWDTDGPEPSNGDGENYAHLLTVNYGPNKQVGDWNDVENTTKYSFYGYLNGGFICEYDTACDHNYVPTVTDATCTEAGYTTYTCSNCGGSYVVDIIPALGHDYNAVVTEPTCTEDGYTIHTCSRCNDSYIDSYVDALGHDFVNGVCSRCGEHDGSIVYGDVNGDNEVDTLDSIRLVRFLVDMVELTDSQKLAADVNHDNDITTTDAIRLVRYLVGFVNDLNTRAIATRGPVLSNKIATITIEDVSGANGETVTIPVSISGNPGFAGFTFEIDFPQRINLIDVSSGPLLKGVEGGLFNRNNDKHLVNWTSVENVEGDGVLFYLTFQIVDTTEDPCEIYVVAKDGKESNFANENGEQIVINPFKDMPEKENWAYDPINWAFANHITAGTSATTFSPSAGCTRAQVVTFLWRYAGEPEPMNADNPFEDVVEDDYFFKAVMWAAENGITAGTSETTFSPNATCTRAQIVTFLWRFAGKPSAITATSQFEDVISGSYYEQAVAWAEEKEITAGTSPTSFSPESTCTRAQIVTFLFRNMSKQQ